MRDNHPSHEHRPVDIVPSFIRRYVKMGEDIVCDNHPSLEHRPVVFFPTSIHTSVTSGDAIVVSISQVLNTGL